MHSVNPMKLLALFCVTSSAAAALALDHAGEVVVPRSSSRVIPDGKLVEPAWTQAAAVGPLLTLETTAKPDHDLTQARLLYDERNLYLAVTCKAQPAKPGPKQARDMRGVYAADHVEIFVDPSPNSEDYYQLVIDRSGNVRDVWNTEEKSDQAGAAWNGPWHFSVAETREGWTLEVALPAKTFGADSITPGDLWRLKIGRDAGRDGPIMWPANPTRSFHTRVVDAAVYFGKQNLLVNGDFESGEVARGAPSPWSASLTSREVDNKPQGTVSTIEGGLEPGKRALRVTKLATALWWPQVWDYSYKLAPGGVYEFSIMVKGTLPQVNLRATGRRKGKPAKMSLGVKPTKEFTR